MDQQLSSLNTAGPIDYDNLNIVIRPRPRRRRPSGISLIPFRPYVKCLTSVREPFSHADGSDQWKTTGKNEIFFKQPNARCIGSLIDDCDISDVIRWDIQAESTRLPMMCKLWMIVDGAVVERGKPHLVQDAAVQVFTKGRNLRSILSNEQRYKRLSLSTITTTSDRRRRHSWHDLNEYHSVPYYQYTRSVRLGNQEAIQCDLDNQHLNSVQEYLPFLDEETVDEKQLSHLEEHNARETIHDQSIIEETIHISIMTQTEHQFVDKSTEIGSDFLLLFNHHLQSNENLLSSIVNPYMRNDLSDYHIQTTRTTLRQNRIEYSDKMISTGDDYPHWWLLLPTDLILSDRIINEDEQNKYLSKVLSPRHQNQSIQTEIDTEQFSAPSPSTRSPRVQKSSSSVTINDNIEIIDQINDGNNSRRILPSYDQRQRIDSDSRLSDYQIEISSDRDHSRLRHRTTSSKQSDTDYNTFALSLNQQSYSTPEPRPIPSNLSRSSYNLTNRRKRCESPSTTMLADLFERYEKTLRERQRTVTIINNQLLDIDDVLQRYRTKIQNTDNTIEVDEDINIFSSERKEETPRSSSLSLSRLTKSKYRTMPNVTSEQMLECHIPSPRLYIQNSPRQRQPRFNYCELYLTDYGQNSAWIRYNEQRIDQLQKRIDLMLQIDDFEDHKFFFIPDTVTERIDNIIMRRPKRYTPLTYYYNRILLPPRYTFRYPTRLNNSIRKTPRLLTRNLTYLKRPISKTVRISTDLEKIRLHAPLKTASQPTVSILRRNNTNTNLNSQRSVEKSHVWKNDIDGKVYILREFSIPRYYRLYNDASFRQVYNFSCLMEPYLNLNNSQFYSSLVKKFAVERQLPTITTAA